MRLRGATDHILRLVDPPEQSHVVRVGAVRAEGGGGGAEGCN